MTRQKLLYFMYYYVEKQVLWRAKKCKFVALLRGKAGFLITRQKLLYFMYYYVEKQVFSWHAKKVHICCIITFRSRFSRDEPKTLTFDAWCIVTCKNRFSHDAPKRCKFVALLRGKAGFLMTQPKTKCIFDALLRFKAGFLMTRQKLLYLMHFYMEKQVFSWRDGKQSVYLMHYYGSKQVYSWRAKNFYIWCIVTRKSRFSHDAPKRCKFVALLRGKAGFLMTWPKTKCI